MLDDLDDVDKAFHRLLPHSNGRLIESTSRHTVEPDALSLAYMKKVTGYSLKGSGNHNWIITGSQVNLNNTIIDIVGNNNIIFFGPNSQISSSHIMVRGNHGICYVGAFTTASTLTVYLMGDSAKAIIGDKCMFSSRIIMSNSDLHAIYDISNGQRLNHNRNIEIGDHVWLGREVRVNKGTTIGRNTIVGQGAVTRSKMDANSVYSGNPVVKVREGVTWSRMSCDSIDDMAASPRHNHYLAKIEHIRRRSDLAGNPSDIQEGELEWGLDNIRPSKEN